MKILVVSHEYPPIGGGGANACIHLTREFAKAGHEVTIVTANFQSMEYKTVENGTVIYRVHSKRTYSDHSSFSEMLSFIQKAYPVCCKLQEEKHFDVCLVFFGIPSGVVGYRLKKKYRLPYTIRFGGGDIPGAQKRFDKVYKLIAPAIRLIWKNAAYRIANSNGLRELAYRFCDKYRFDVIYNGVDTESFIPNSGIGVGGCDKFRILFVSRLVEVKGLQYLIPQLRRARENCSREIRLTVVGEGPMRPELERLTKENALEDVVEFVGQKSKEEVATYYQEADLFVLPSGFEGMPNVVLEAMASGLPIMMTPCPGSEELIQGNGFVLEASQFGEKIAEVINDNLLLAEYGRKSRQIVMEEFDWKSSADQYIAMFQKLQNG